MEHQKALEISIIVVVSFAGWNSTRPCEETYSITLPLLPPLLLLLLSLPFSLSCMLGTGRTAHNRGKQ